MVGDVQNKHFWDTVHVVCSPKVIFVGNVRVHDPLVTVSNLWFITPFHPISMIKYMLTSSIYLGKL